jgi:5'-3' exonuclease
LGKKELQKMGIRGLFTFVENNQNQFMVDYALHSSTIIVDANNLLHLLYRTCSGLNAAFGGDYDKVYSHFDAFCSLLDTCNIKPIMVFDGGLDVDNRKEKTRKKRIRMRMRAAISCDPYRQGSLEVFPLFGKDIFIDACRKHSFQVVQCDYEADDEIALLSRILNCPVLSGDSDFIIFGIELIPLNSLSFSPSLIKVDGGERTAISCKMFYVDHFLKKIGSLPRSHLPLVGILLGNDYVDLESFQKLWSGMSISKEKGVTDIHRRLKAVTSWLRGQKIESAVEKVSFFSLLEH